MIKEYNVFAVRMNYPGATDCDGQSLTEGVELCDLTLLLDSANPAGELESQLDWDGEFSPKTMLLFAVYCLADNSPCEYHLVQRTEEHGAPRANGWTDELADWVHRISLEKDSAFELWLSPAKAKVLKAILEAGGEMRSEAFEIEYDEDFSTVCQRVTAPILADGWTIFATEDNISTGEVIFVKLAE